jgi:hypothetical protein
MRGQAIEHSSPLRPRNPRAYFKAVGLREMALLCGEPHKPGWSLDGYFRKLYALVDVRNRSLS